MFQQDYGFGPAKWLPWLIAAATIYGILTLFPDAEYVATKITSIVVVLIVAALWKRIIKWLS